MPRLSINEITTYRWSFEDDVARYAAAGIPAIGVWRQKLSDYGEEKGVELLADSPLAVSNLLWAGGFTGSDGRSYRGRGRGRYQGRHLSRAVDQETQFSVGGYRGFRSLMLGA